MGRYAAFLCVEDQCEKTPEGSRRDASLRAAEARRLNTMRTEVKNRSNPVNSDGNSSKMVYTGVTRQLLHSDLQTNGSATAVTCPSCTEGSVTKPTSGIVPGAIAATVFIAFILALYTVLWKCMVSPPQRKPSKVRVRIQHKNSA